MNKENLILQLSLNLEADEPGNDRYKLRIPKAPFDVLKLAALFEDNGLAVIAVSEPIDGPTEITYIRELRREYLAQGEFRS